MKNLNESSTAIFQKIIAIAKQNEEHYTKIQNNQSFMALSVERVECLTIGEIWSFCHYGEQNGDLMRDPEVTFLVYPNQFVFPLSFRNDYLGINRESVFFEDGKPTRFLKREYNDLRRFCHSWLKNIKHQQFS